MKTFKRYSAARKFAAGRALVKIRIGSEEIFLVPADGEAIDPLDGVDLIADKGTAGNISFGHLDRLGNANGAAAAKEEYRTTSAFPIERRRGMAHKFQCEDEKAVFETDREVFMAGSRQAFFGDQVIDNEATWDGRAGFRFDQVGQMQAEQKVRDLIAEAANIRKEG